MNVSSADDFAPDPCFCWLSYHRSRPYCSPYQAGNVSSIDKPSDHRSSSTSLSTSSQTSAGADTLQIHNARPHYSYNFNHHLDMADSLKMMNQELLRPKDWVSPTVSDSQEKFIELSTIDISMIEVALFNTFVQRTSHTKNMEIFSLLICAIEKVLAPKSPTNPEKKLPTEYHDFLNVLSQADSDVLPAHRLYYYKILLMEDKTQP